MSRNADFTTSILHADRDAPIEHGSLHKPLHLSVAYGYRDARELAAVFQGKAQGYAYGRQGNPTAAALEEKVNRDGAGRGHGVLRHRHGGDRCDHARAAARPAITSCRSAFLFGNTNSLFNTLEAHGGDVSFVDATDVARGRGGAAPATRIVFVETIANPRTQVADLERIGALCASAASIYVVDNTMTSPYLFLPKTVGASLVVNALTKYIGGHGNALGGAITDTGLFDWTRYPNIHDSYKGAEARPVGHHADPQEGPARLGRHAGGRAGAPYRRGAETLALRMDRACANALALARVPRGASAGARRLLPRARLASAARAGDRTVRRATARCCPSSSTRRSIASTSSIASSVVISRRTSATTARWRFPWRIRFSTRWVRDAAPAWASPTR